MIHFIMRKEKTRRNDWTNQNLLKSIIEQEEKTWETALANIKGITLSQVWIQHKLKQPPCLLGSQYIKPLPTTSGRNRMMYCKHRQGDRIITNYEILSQHIAHKSLLSDIWQQAGKNNVQRPGKLCM